jgi:hypothetical protein
MTEFAKPIGRPPSIELIPPTDLMIDTSYQRSIMSSASQGLISRIANGWDWRLCVPLLVSRRDDGLYVIDGQHRWQAATRRGDILYLPCCVSQYASPGEEAAIFVDANRKRRSVVRVDTFRAAIVAGDPTAMSIMRLLEDAGLKLARASGHATLGAGELNCVVALERTLITHGEARLAATLKLIAGAFPGETYRHGSPLVQAVAALLQSNGTNQLRSALARQTSDEWAEVASRTISGPIGGQSMVWAMRKVIGDALADGKGPAGAIAAESPRLPVATKTPSHAAARPPGAPKRSFEETMAAVAAGARLITVTPLRKPDGDVTLGGIGSAML